VFFKTKAIQLPHLLSETNDHDTEQVLRLQAMQLNAVEHVTRLLLAHALPAKMCIYRSKPAH
jgi:hypothetical protein